MELKDKVYQYIQDKEFFNKNIHTTVEMVFSGIKSSKISRKKIYDSIIELNKLGSLSIEEGIIKNNTKLLQGKYYTSKNGNGVVVVNQNGKSVQYFVPERASLNAANKSTVGFVLENIGTERENAKVVKIVETENDLLYGQVIEEVGKCVFIPDNKAVANKIDIVQNELSKSAIGKRCSIHLITSSLKNREQEVFGQITEEEQVFGFINNPMANIDSIIKESGVPVEFSDAAHEEAANIPTVVSQEEIISRLDLRSKNFVTIDPATCKDMDDAVCVEEWVKHGVPVGYRLYVAIADVASYVERDSIVDKEAYDRGTSIYPAGTVIPMLPEKLSNGICSLSSGVDRLAMVTIMDINKQGKIVGYNIHNGVINSKQKFSYEEVSALHANEADAVEKFSTHKPMIDMLYELEECIGRQAKREGTLTIEGYEPTIVLSKSKDKVIDYKNDNHVDSHKVIERAMVANNTTVATFLKELGIANIVRIHESPSEKKFDQLIAKLFDLGLDIDGEPNNKIYQQMLDLIKEQPISKVMFSLVVRSMKKAAYDTDLEVGHFALALKNYTHFTSPIRRYVDLIQHRLVKDAIKTFDKTINDYNIDTTNKNMSDLLPQVKHYAKAKLEKLSNEHDLYEQAFYLNRCDATADEVSQKADAICAALYMADKVGTVQKGYVSKIDKNQIIMTIYDENDLEHSNIIEVAIPMGGLSKVDTYHTDKNKCAIMSGTNNKILYQLGDAIEAKIMLSDPITRTILATTDLTRQPNQEEQEMSA